jgi:hypothetical protein
MIQALRISTDLQVKVGFLLCQFDRVFESANLTPIIANTARGSCKFVLAIRVQVFGEVVIHTLEFGL